MKKKLLFIVLILLVIITEVSAHPHVFIKSSVSIEFNAVGLDSINVNWVFDEMFSAGIIMDYDNGDLILNSEEQYILKRDVFDNLIHFGYFMHITVNGKPFSVEFVKNFKASVDNNQLVYSFQIPCRVPVSASSKQVEIDVVDDSNYSAITSIKHKNNLINTTSHHVILKYNDAEKWIKSTSPDAVGSMIVVFFKQ